MERVEKTVSDNSLRTPGGDAAVDICQLLEEATQKDYQGNIDCKKDFYVLLGQDLVLL